MAAAEVLRRRTKAFRAFEAPAEVCTMLKALGTAQVVPRHTMLFRKGDPPRGVFVIAKGRVALSAGDDPCRITRIAGVDSLLGLPSTVNNRAYSLTAEAVTDAELYQVTPAVFRKALASNPVIGLAIVKILSEEVSVLRRFAVYKA